MSNPYEQCARCGSLMVDRAAHLSWHREQDRRGADLVDVCASIVDALVAVGREQDRRHSDLVDACAAIVDALVAVGRVQDLTAQIEDL